MAFLQGRPELYWIVADLVAALHQFFIWMHGICSTEIAGILYLSAQQTKRKSKSGHPMPKIAGFCKPRQQNQHQWPFADGSAIQLKNIAHLIAAGLFASQPARGLHGTARKYLAGFGQMRQLDALAFGGQYDTVVAGNRSAA